MAQPIQTRLTLLFGKNEKDVTENLMPDLLSFEFDDKESNEADEISITLKDEKGMWAGRFCPKGGEVVRAIIVSGDTMGGVRGVKRDCGRFYVDTMTAAGSPRTFELKAVSIPLKTPIRRKLKTRAWEKYTLKDIAGKIAKEANIALVYDADDPISYDRQDQDRESDLKFLSRLCEEAGLSIKVSDEKLVIFDQQAYEKKQPVRTFALGVSDILSWNFQAQQSETYKTCTVKYRDPKQKKRGTAASYDTELDKNWAEVSGEGKKASKNPAVMSYTYTDPQAEENGQEYALKRRAKSIEEAKRLAKAKLRQLNARKVTGNITIIGDPGLNAGDVITISGFGSFDGNMIISNASHSISSSGYVTSLSLRRVNSDY